MTEVPITIDCDGDRLIGILHGGDKDADVGVVIVVGGPQYRVGSHRQFVLMARSLASAGYPVFRFDYRGMGDSEGETRSFDQVEKDIQSSIDQFCGEMQGLKKIVLLGLCDAASANVMYAWTDDRVSGLVLINPWVRTPQGEAKAYLRHYYFQRLFQKSFWRKVASGEFGIARSLLELFGSIRDSRGSRTAKNSDRESNGTSFVTRMLSGFKQFQNPILVLISGRDLTAKEFVDLCQKDKSWRSCMNQVRVMIDHFPDADHTMSSREHLRAATSVSITWISDNFGN